MTDHYNLNCNYFQGNTVWKGPFDKRHRATYKDNCTFIKELSEEQFSLDEVKLACEQESGCNLLSQKKQGNKGYRLRKCTCPIPTPERIPTNPEITYYIDC